MAKQSSQTTHEHQQPADHAAHQQHAGGAGTDHPPAHAASQEHQAMDHDQHAGDHGDHVDHTGHEEMFKRRFWISLILSIPVLVYSPTIQDWLGFTAPTFPGSRWITPLFAVIIFAYGGVPFLQMARPEVRRRQPGMMTLISLAISVAFVYSLATLFIDASPGFFWELVTLIDVMLLGHWIEMRSVRQASGALDELAKLMPDTAERIIGDGETEDVSVAELQADDLVLVRPGASIPADGEVAEPADRISALSKLHQSDTEPA